MTAVIDPNEDILGYVFADDSGRTLTVERTESWSPQYVRVTSSGGYVSTRLGELVRVHRARPSRQRRRIG